MLSLNCQLVQATPAAEPVLTLTAGTNAALIPPQTKLPADPKLQSTDPAWQQKAADAWQTLFSHNNSAASRNQDSVPRWTLPALIMALLGLLWLISRSQRHG